MRLKHVTAAEFRRYLARPRPNLLLPPEGAAGWRQSAASDWGRPLAAKVVADAQRIRRFPPLARVLTGRRLLDVSRSALYRVNTLGAAWCLTGDDAFADRAVAEIKNLCAFSDWNPSHFLDAAELALAVALGYDRFFARLDAPTREAIIQALVEKALLPSLSPYHWWVTGNNNWTQVCHAGMVAAALVVGDRFPDFALAFFNRAIDNQREVMRLSYADNGAYPEGTMYWGYGTAFAIVMISLFESAFGHDCGLSRMPGFNRTADFMAAATGTSGQMFSHSDSVTAPMPSFPQLWLAARYGAESALPPAAADVLRRALAAPAPRGAALEAERLLGGDRLLPLALAWAEKIPTATAVPVELFTNGRKAEVPIVILRRACEADPWAGLKGGQPAVSHGHMDAGSFILDVWGLRWTEDLGMQPYHDIEKLGMNLWDCAQDSDRWKIFRIGPESHNILRLGDGTLRVRGENRLISVGRGRASFCFDGLYADAARSVKRYFFINAAAFVVIDQVRGLRQPGPATFQFCTAAAVRRTAPREVTLCQGGQKVKVVFEGVFADKEAARTPKITVQECAALQHAYDAPNPGRRVVRCTFAAPKGDLRLTTIFNFW